MPDQNPHPAFTKTLAFLGDLAAPALRFEARVASGEGMPLLCHVEAALTERLEASAARELVWLSDPPPAGREVLRLRAYGADSTLLAEAVHEFATT